MANLFLTGLLFQTGREFGTPSRPVALDRLLADAANARGAALVTPPAPSLNAIFPANTRVRDWQLPNEALTLGEPLLVALAERDLRCRCLRGTDGKVSASALWLHDPQIDDRSHRRALAEQELRLREVAERYAEALSESPALWRARIEAMSFHPRLGSIGQRALRLERLAPLVAALADASHLEEDARRAANLSQLDFGTRLVQVDPSLHALAGSALFAALGESEAVTRALASHVEPREAGSQPPEDVLGTVLSVAERLDVLLGAFGNGLAPTPTEDPLGARGQAYGLLRGLLSHSLDLDLAELVEAATPSLNTEGAWLAPRDAGIRVLGFLRHRLKVLLCQQYPDEAVHQALQSERLRPARIHRWLNAEFG